MSEFTLPLKSPFFAVYDSRYIFRSTSAFQNLSSLIADVNAKTYWQWLILLDEVTVGIGCQDFSSLHLYDNVEMVIAVNPTLSDEAFNIIPPKDKRFLFKRLRFKHRNSLEISVFLLHFKKKMNDPGVLYVSTFKQYVIQNTSIPDSEDTALVESALPAIDKVHLAAGILLLLGFLVLKPQYFTLKPGVEVHFFHRGSKLSRDKNSETPNFTHFHPETSMGKLLKVLPFFSTNKLVTENILQNFEQISHRGLWTKMLEI